MTDSANPRKHRPSTRIDLAAMVYVEKSAYEQITRIVQVTGTAIGLMLFSPVFLAIAVLTKLTSAGPVFYRGKRVGRDGKSFFMYKFRTMRVGAEAEIGGRLISDKDHHLITPLGRILKKTKLDELPQLWNVLRGDMNLVGPRPVRPALADKYRQQVEGYDQRFLVLPGMSGIAQIRGDYFLSPRRKLKYELLYIRNRSVLLDLWYVILAFLKLGERLVSSAAVMLGLLAIVSFVPVQQLSLGYSTIQGVRVKNIYILIALAGIGMLLAKRRRHRLFLFRTPIDLYAILFAGLGVASALLENMRFPPLRGIGYYAVTGLLVCYVVINTRISGRLDLRTAQAMSIIGICVALGAMLPILLTHSPGDSLTLLTEGGGNRRLGATFQNPMVLACYLTMVIPLLGVHLLHARAKRHRFFWGVGLAVAVTALVLTFTRGALFALAVGGVLFAFRKSWRAGVCFVTMLVLALLVSLFLGGERFTIAGVGADLARRSSEVRIVLSRMDLKEWLIGVGARNLAFRKDLWPLPEGPHPKIGSMHLHLLIEHGILGFAVFASLMMTALRHIWKIGARLEHQYRRDLLMGVCSSLLAAMVLMLAAPVLSVVSLQVLFWGLLGLGLGMAVHRDRGSYGVMVVWKFGREAEHP